MVILNFITTIKKKIKLVLQILGTHDIGDIGDGTVTGAIDTLSTGLRDHKTSSDHDNRYLQKSAVINNNTTTEYGYALDARQANPNMSGSLGAQINSLNRTLATQISELNTNLARVGNYKMIGQWYSANINTSYTTEIENVTNYRFLLLGLKYGSDYLQTYFIPSHFAVNNIKSYNLYNSGVLAGNITFNSATSVTFTQNKVTYAPMEIYGVN